MKFSFLCVCVFSCKVLCIILYFTTFSFSNKIRSWLKVSSSFFLPTATMSFTAFTHTYTYVHYHHRGEYNKFWLYWWHSWKVACTDFEIEFTTFEYFLFDDDRKIHEQHRKNVAWAFQYEIHLLNIDRFRRNFWKVPNLIGFRDLTKPIDSTHTQMKRHQMLIALFFRINKNISNNRYQSCPRFSFRSSHSFIQLEF